MPIKASGRPAKARMAATNTTGRQLGELPWRPEYRAAVVGPRGLPDADRAAGEVLAPLFEQAYQARIMTKFPGRRFTVTSGHACLHRLSAGRCGGYRCGCGCPALPGADHSLLWLLDGRPFAYVTQPYGFNHKALQEALAACERWGLEMLVDAASWHFPTATLLVEVRRSEDWESPTRALRPVAPGLDA